MSGESGDWQGLAEPTQAPRYRLIASVIDRFCPNGSVLDVGCGEAVLRDYLPDGITYQGIDISEKAVESARAKHPNESIVHSAAEDFDPQGLKWDCIVFSESLYYSSSPLGLLSKYANLLSPNGTIIISIYQKPESFKHRLMRWRFPMSNARCTNRVLDYIARTGWTVERDELVAIPRTGKLWRILVTRPRVVRSKGRAAGGL